MFQMMTYELARDEHDARVRSREAANLRSLRDSALTEPHATTGLPPRRTKR